jgi:hypothetical protein
MRDKTACLPVPDVNVLDGWFAEDARDDFFRGSVINFFAGDEPPIVSVAFEDEWELAESVGKFAGAWVCGAGVFVNEDWTWRWIRIEAFERIVGEKDSALFSNIEGAKTLAARASSAGELDVSWVAVLGRLQCNARGAGDFLRDCVDCELSWLHVQSPRSLSRWFLTRSI